SLLLSRACASFSARTWPSAVSARCSAASARAERVEARQPRKPHAISAATASTAKMRVSMASPSRPPCIPPGPPSPPASGGSRQAGSGWRWSCPALAHGLFPLAAHHDPVAVVRPDRTILPADEPPAGNLLARRLVLATVQQLGRRGVAEGRLADVVGEVAPRLDLVELQSGVRYAPAHPGEHPRDVARLQRLALGDRVGLAGDDAIARDARAHGPDLPETVPIGRELAVFVARLGQQRHKGQDQGSWDRRQPDLVAGLH